MDELVSEFVTETNESLNQLDSDLVLLERDPANAALLSKIFRIMHTIKGTCGFLNLPRMERVAHAAEDLLDLFRNGKMQPSSACVSLVLESLDTIKMIIAVLSTGAAEPPGDDSSLINRLHVAAAGGETPMVSQNREQSASPLPPDHDVGPTPAAMPEASLVGESLRVSVKTLEDLMTAVSELVLTRNQILQITQMQKNSELSASLQRLNHIVSDLQEKVIRTRMQPVGNAWSKLPRIVRDIAGELGKKIELDMQGQDTELDRQVLEMIKDPLTHMVRNAVDHGIEPPSDRVMAGKPETGHIRLNSWHEGGQIIIEIADDGKGLPLERIKRKILENRLATETELAVMPPRDIQQFIFHAGFSTAETITAVSGRGVGMDVVRVNIQKIGGSIEMRSTEGAGTTFTIKIPLTLAIVSSLLVGVGEERFAIPQLDVHKLVMISAQSNSRVEMVNGVPLYRLHGKLLPLVDLRDLLKMPARLPPTDVTEEVVSYIVAIRIGLYNFGLIVDDVFDTEEIVVKPVTTLVRHLPVFSGNTILGDGQVIMILDSAGIIHTAGIDNAAYQTAEDTTAIKEPKSELPLLLFETGGENAQAIKAVPLEVVSRLEEIDLARLEYAGGRAVVQYRDILMPLFQCDGLPIPRAGRRPVIVFSTNDKLAGLVVNEIFDITAYQGDLPVHENRDIPTSVIVQGRATDIINLDYETRTSSTSHYS